MGSAMAAALKSTNSRIYLVSALGLEPRTT
jgi:hypothetical protein